MKKRFVSELKAGDPVDDVFALTEKTLSQKRDGKNFLNVTLTDRTGSIKGVVWDEVDRIAPTVSSGDFVHVLGGVSEYRGTLQMTVKKIRPVPPEEVAPDDFLPRTGRDPDKMFEDLAAVTEAFENPHLRALFQAFFQDADFVRRFKTAPAAKHMHHAYLGGLLEHTLSMVRLVGRIQGHYAGIDWELLLTGVILHDIGKIREFTYRYAIDYSDEGRLLSHIVIGTEMIGEKIREIEGFPEELAFLVKHLVISHHGSREFGSPEVPKTIEAVLLNYIDEMDSKVNGIRDFISGEDPGESWTGYHKLYGRQFFTRKKE